MEVRKPELRLCKKIIPVIFLSIFGIVYSVPAESNIVALRKIEEIQVYIEITDRTIQKISRDINNEVLTKYVEERLSSLLKKDKDIVLFNTSAPVLDIHITIEEKNDKKNPDIKTINTLLYYADIKASIQRGEHKWSNTQSCSWQKKDDKSTKKAEHLITHDNEDQSMSTTFTFTGTKKAYGFSTVANTSQDTIKNATKGDYELLYEKKHKLTSQYAIEQALSKIMDSFAGDYVLVISLPDKLELRPGNKEKTISLQQDDELFVETENIFLANIPYEIGETIELRNPSDTVFTLYKDDSLSNTTILFTNGITANIMDFKVLPDNPTVYKIQILLNGGSEYIGWVPESVISKK